MSTIYSKLATGINEILRPTASTSKIKSLFDLWKIEDLGDLCYKTVVNFLQICIDKKEYNPGRLMHQHLYANGYHSYVHINTKLVILYSKAGDMKSARKVFDEMPERNVVSWTAIISGYAQSGSSNEAMKVFTSMHRAGVKANQFTYASVLSACTSLMCLRFGMQIQSCVYKSRFLDYLFVKCALVELHSKCGKMEDACYVFDSISDKDLVSWNSMIGGFAVRGFSDDAILMFRLMLRDGMTPDNYTLASVLTACARGKDLSKVNHLHGFVLKLGFGSYNSLNGSLINAYSKSGNIKSANKLYKNMKLKDTISCTALITGYAQEGSNNNSMNPLNLFIELHRAVVYLDNLILCSTINICANMASLCFGRQIHALSLKCFSHDIPTSNALIDMYSKSGEIMDARQVFDEMPERNVISWTSLITGYGKHGYGHNAISLYKKMVNEGFEPNDITFLALMFSCSHSGLITQGREFFNSMVSKYDILPQTKHYSCMVDLLARGGEIREAYYLIQNMRVKPDASIWGAILGACSVYGNVAIGKIAAKRLFDLAPRNSVNYVVLASVYAGVGLWDGALDTRKLMEVRKLRKQCGHSFFQSINNRILLS